MPPRKRKKQARASTAKVDVVHVDTPEMLVVQDFPVRVGAADVAGRFVKVAPILSASKRDSFNAKGIRRTLMDYGALAVVLAPQIVPDREARKEKRPKGLKPRDLVKLWLADAKLDPTTEGAVAELVYGYMDQEGL